MRASLAINQGRQLMPMGENGSGTFFIDCAGNDEGSKTDRIKQTTNATFRRVLQRVEWEE
jgi:hypothetical protein